MKKGVSLMLSLCLGLTCAASIGAGCGDNAADNSNTSSTPSVVEEDYTAHESYDLTKLDVEKYITPVWNGTVSYAEAAFVMENENGKVEPLSLLYPIVNIVSVRSADLSKKYTQGVDYDVTEDGKLVILEGGSIPYLKYSDYYYETYDKSNSLSLPANAPTGAYICTEATTTSPGMSQWCLAVTYTHKSASVVGIPEDKSATFSSFNSKLLAGEKVKVAYFGDSITDGWGSTAFKYVNRAPYCPMYADLAMDRLEAMYNTQIERVNYSVSGYTSLQAYENEELMNKVKNSGADLVVLAFGMNDGCGRQPTQFSDTIKRIVNAILNVKSDTEIVVVLSMVPNEKMGFSQNSSLRNFQDDYPEELAKCEATWKKSGKKVAVANVTDVHKAIIAVKKFQDTTSSNSNHPNDYMHRVYAQVLLRTLVGDVAF